VPSPDPAWTDVAQTVVLGLQLLLLVIAARFGWNQLSEAKELREEQTRPFVVIDLESTRKPFFDLVVKNLGATMARNVRFKFDPPAESTLDGVSLDKLKLYRDGISTLPPGKEIRFLFDTGPERHARSDLPDVYEVTVTYAGHTGKHEYEERIDLDFGLYWNRMNVTLRDVHDLHRELKAIREEIGKWSPTVGRGLLHVTPKDVQERIGETIGRRSSRQSSPRRCSRRVLQWARLSRAR
jgi:hypothetical protein